MEEREGKGDCGGPSAPPPPTTMNFPPSSEDEFVLLLKLLKWGCYKVRSRRFPKRLTEESDKREGGGAPLTNSPLFSPPAADISCGSFQIVVTGAADKREEDMFVIDKIEEEQEQEAAEEEEEEEEEDILSDGSPPMSKENWVRYLQQVKDSEGFDVDNFPGRIEDNLLGPIGGSYDDDINVEVGQHAINRYNARKKDAPIEFVRVVKIISNYDAWMLQYVTLEGRDTGDDNKIKTYQAQVLVVPQLGEYVLKMFRLKPSAETPTSKEKKHPLGECCGECLRVNVEQDDKVGPEHDTPLPPAKKPRVENDEEQPQEHPQPQSSANSSPSNDDCSDGYDSDDHDPMFDEDFVMRDYEISLEAPIEGFASAEEAEEFFRKHYQSDNDHLDRKSAQGGPEYTQEDLERYYEQLEDSQGFDVDYFPNMENLGFVTPIRDEEVVNNRFTEHAKLAIEFHNKEEGVQLQLHKIIKVNCLDIGCCSHAYITFEAINAADGVHDEPKTYQARILTIRGRMKVEEVRQKP